MKLSVEAGAICIVFTLCAYECLGALGICISAYPALLGGSRRREKTCATCATQLAVNHNDDGPVENSVNSKPERKVNSLPLREFDPATFRQHANTTHDVVVLTFELVHGLI
jgi:hypothetical protein